MRSMDSTGAGGKEALAMVDDKVEWEVCEEREGRNRVQAKMIVLDHAYRSTGAKLGQKLLFCPRNALRIPQKSPRSKVGQGWGV